jgi:GAF domain-containing protein
MMNPEKVRGIFDPETATESGKLSVDSSTSMTPSRADIHGLDERELLMELIREISNELDVQRLSHKILVNIGVLTNADRCSLFLAEGSKDNRILVSKLFDVTSESTLEATLRENNDRVYTVPFGVGIAGYSAQTGETINIRNAYEVSGDE